MSFIQNQLGLVGSGGYIYMNNSGTGVTFSITTSYQEVASLGTSFTLASTSPDFAMTTDGRLKYTGLRTKNFMANAVFCIGSNSVSSYAIQIYKNGSATGLQLYATSISTLALTKIPVSLSTNDYISLYAKRATNGTPSLSSVEISIISTNGS